MTQGRREGHNGEKGLSHHSSGRLFLSFPSVLSLFFLRCLSRSSFHSMPLFPSCCLSPLPSTVCPSPPTVCPSPTPTFCSFPPSPSSPSLLPKSIFSSFDYLSLSFSYTVCSPLLLTFSVPFLMLHCSVQSPLLLTFAESEHNYPMPISS